MLILLYLGAFFCGSTGATAKENRSVEPFSFYIAKNGNDGNPGTKNNPFARLERARDAVRDLKRTEGLPRGGVQVLIREGRYFLSQTFHLKSLDSGLENAPVVYAAYPGEKVVLSGGREIIGWKNVRGNLWTVALPRVKSGEWYFRQLFADGKRLTRARSPNRGHFTTEGPLTKYAKRSEKRWGGRSGIGNLRKEAPEAYCGFRFKPGDIREWSNWRDAEIITFHSWECSWQTVRRIDMEKNDVYLNSPCRYPIGYFSANARYRVENISEALDEAGEWQLDRRTGLLSYLAKPGEDPNRMDFVAPVLDKFLVLEGDPGAGKPVEHIRFRGLSFQHARYPMGLYDVARDWPASAVAAHGDWPEDFPPGFTDAQAAPLCGQAIELRDARHCALERCEIAHVGAYAVKIFKRSHHNSIVGCDMHDLGGGGVLIGSDNRSITSPEMPREDASSHNSIVNCRIRHTSLVHPSAVGVWIAQSHHNTVSHNEIAHVGYAGIHVGWAWGRAPNHTDHNTIASNDIHHVMRDLSDAGGLYSLGVQTGTVFRENYIHDIQRAEGAIGAPTDGIFFDQGSQDILVQRNVLRRVGESVIRFNQCVKDDMIWETNDIGTEGNRIVDHRRKKVLGDVPLLDPTTVERIMRQSGPESSY